MGRIHAKKGLDILIKAFREIISHHPDARLLIAGQDEGEQPLLEKLIRELSLEQRVHFTGSLGGQEKVDFLAHADLFVLPSHNENFGNVYAEALAAGTPIVASTHTPWQEVEAQQCGRWVPNTVAATKMAMLELLNRDLQPMSHHAKEYVQRYAWAEVGKQFGVLIREIKNISTR